MNRMPYDEIHDFAMIWPNKQSIQNQPILKILLSTILLSFEEVSFDSIVLLQMQREGDYNQDEQGMLIRRQKLLLRISCQRFRSSFKLLFKILLIILIKHQMIIYKIMNNYNSPLYYRSNPYAETGYLPPGAHKNRRAPLYGVQLPQGELFFQPTTKKHYGSSYNNQIKMDHLMQSVQPNSPLQSQALQRSYFRSLNSKDIQGASTNTLISKAVKNKMKAQQELARRKEQQKFKAYSSRVKEQQDNLYKIYHKNQLQQSNSRNFHTVQKKDEPQKNYHNYHQRNHTQIPLLNEEQSYKQLQNDLMKKARENNSGSTRDFEQQYRQNNRREQNQKYSNSKQELYLENNKKNQYQNYQMPNRQPPLNSKNNYPEYNQGNNIERNLNYYEDQRFNSYDQNVNDHNRNSMRRKAQYSSNNNNYQKNYNQVPSSNQHNQYQHAAGKDTNQNGYNNYNVMNNNSEHRKINPTYLSYGSPSFAVASRNVIGH